MSVAAWIKLPGGHRVGCAHCEELEMDVVLDRRRGDCPSAVFTCATPVVFLKKHRAVAVHARHPGDMAVCAAVPLSHRSDRRLLVDPDADLAGDVVPVLGVTLGITVDPI